MKVTIPANIDVVKMLKDQNLSKTRLKSMRDKMYYFLSILTRTNDNSKFLLDSEKYKKVCSCILKKLLGNKDYYEIIKILESKNEPIIEKNKKWKSSLNNAGQCQGYRINKIFDTGNTKMVRINKSLSDKIKENSINDISTKYSFLTKQFKIHKITLDDRVYDYLKKYYIELKLLAKDNEYQNIVLNNHIGRWLDYINKIKNNNLWYNVSKENHRLSSTFTSIPKELRKFILINGKPLEMIDIKSSQPYILSSIIKTKYFLENNNGYNLKTIHPKAYKQVMSIINETNKLYQNNPIISASSPYKQSITRTSLYMWCEFLAEKEAQTLAEYALYPFEKDFYMDIIDTNSSNFDYQRIETRIELREKLKSVMMLILFDDNFKNRNNNPFIKLFNKIYPGVNAWIEKMHRMIGKNEFSYIMQRTESYLLLDNACREFNLKYPNAPIFTIHDGLYTTEEFIRELSLITNTTLTNLTGSKPGIKYSYDPATTDPESVAISDKWKKIKKINSRKKFLKIEHTILEHNIKMAAAFSNNL